MTKMIRHLPQLVKTGIAVFLALAVILTGFPLSVMGWQDSEGGIPVVHAEETAPGTILYRMSLNATGTTSSLGVTLINDKIIVSNTGNSSDDALDNRFFRLNLDGTLIDSFPQGSLTGWGFRDLAFDGNCILGSEGATIKKVDPNTFAIVGSLSNPDNSIHRGLAYDASDYSIWSTNFVSGPLVKINAITGETVKNLGTPSVAPYGIALDPFTTPGTTSLWYAEPSNTGIFRLSRVSTLTGVVTYTIDLSEEVPGGLSGGLEVINNHPDYPGRVIAVMLEQINDELIFVDITDVPDPLPEPEPLPDSIDVVGHTGGFVNAAAVSGNYACVCEASTLKVVDISGEEPQQVAVVYIPGEDEAIGISIVGNYAYMYYGNKIHAVDISNPLNPVTAGIGEVAGLTWMQNVHFTGSHAYIPAGDTGLLIVDISNPSSPAATANISIKTSNVFVLGNYAYAITGNSANLTIFDVSNPVYPSMVSDNIIDPSDDIFVAGDYAYLTGGINMGMRIYDIHDPANPTEAGTAGIPTETHGFIQVLNNYAYVEDIIDPPYGSRKLSIYDITNVNFPDKVGEVGEFGMFFSLAVSGTTACIVSGGAYQLIDVTTAGNPVLDQKSKNPAMVEGICISGDYLYAGAVDGIYRFSLSDPASPAVQQMYPQWANTQRVIGKDNYLYAIIDGQLYIINITDPDNPQQTAVYTPAEGYKGCEVLIRGNYAYLAAIEDIYYMPDHIIEIVDISQPANPTKVSGFTLNPISYRVNFSIKDLFIPENAQELYVVYSCQSDITGSPYSGFQIFDISTPSAPAWLGTKDQSYSSVSIWVEGNVAFLGTESNGDGYVRAYDVTDKTNPVWMDTEYLWDCSMWDIEVVDGVIIASAPYGSIHTYQFNPNNNQLTSGPVAHMPESADMATYRGEGGTYVYSNSGYTDYGTKYTCGSKGIYTVRIPQGEPGKSYVVAIVNPPEAASDGCTAEPSEPVECEGNPVTVTATAEDPWTFKEWTGAASGASLITTAECPEEGTAVAVANFECPILTLTPGPQNPSYNSKHADGTETNATNPVIEVTKDPGNYSLVINIEPPQARTEGCTVTPTVGLHEYAPGSQVSLTAQAVDRWHFSEWTGNASGSGPVDITMNGDKMVTARFVKEVPIIDIRLTANEVDDWFVTSVTFQAYGRGDDKEDVKDARLYFMGSTLLDTGSYSVDDGTITFNVNKTVPKNSTITLLMTYTFDERKALPCDEYSAKITMANVSALPIEFPPGLKLPVPPSEVSGGPTHIMVGNIVAESGNEQWGMKGQALAKPLVAKVYHQHPDTIDYVKFLVSQGQWGQSYGTKLSNNEFESHITLDSAARARETLTLGTLLDLFGTEHAQFVEIEAKLKVEDCPAHLMSVFTEYAIGMEVAAQYDGNRQDTDRVDMFVSNIEARNRFTATLEIDPAKTINQVTFDLDGNAQQGEVVTPNREYRSTFDMAPVDGSATMTVTAAMNDGTEIQKVISLESIHFPAWFDTITSISESFTKEFQGEDEKYRVGFSYPVNFAWSDAVPGNVGMLGGLDFGVPVEFNVWADYYLNQRSGFGGEASGTLTILGQEIDAEGSLNGNFNELFEFDRGSGQMSITTSFDLPSKGFSRTFPVSGIPVTVAGEIGGNIRLNLNGSAVLNSDIEFETASITPGVTISGTITVSISAAFGVLKASVIGEPTATLEIQINYTSASGTTTTWSGTVRVPIRIVGSIFWDAATIDLYSTELGPWNFGTGGGSASSSYSMESLEYSFDTEMPDILSSSSISSGTNQMVVWIADTDPTPGSPNPDVYYRYYNGTAWTAAAPVTGANDFWEMDPVVVSMGDGKALAAWTSNNGSHSLTNLNDILACQDIAYATWNGSSWSEPGYIIDDDESDGVVDLTYDSRNNKIIAAWLHDSNSDLDINTHTEWEVLHSVYDPVTDNWTQPQPVPTTSDGSADFEPAVASDNLGNTFALWVKDGDGVLYQEQQEVTDGANVDFTNPDCNIVWSGWNGTSWSAPLALSENNDRTEQTPTAAFTSNGDGIAAWVTKNGTAASLHYSIYRANSGNWSSPGLVIESDYFIEEPQVVIDSTGLATLVWRGYAGYDGDLFSSTFDLVAGSSWTEPEQLTSDDSTDWHVAIAAGSQDEIIASWSKNDFTSTDDGSVPGFSNNIQLGQTNLDSASLTGNYTDNGTDINDDGLYDYLSVSVATSIKTPGNYRVKAELCGNDKITEAETAATDLPSGNHTFILNFPGGYISDREANGPFVVKNVMLLDENLSPMQTDFAASPHVTANYTFDQFVEGAVSIEKSEYSGTEERATISVRDNGLNTDPGTAETVTVSVSSTVDPSGIPVTLTETGVDSGTFNGTIGFNEQASNITAGEIYVIDRATVLVLYEDVSPSYIWNDSALWLTTTVPGDANGDGEINALDMTRVARIILEMDPLTPGADANQDGTVNILDMTKIARIILGLD